MKILYGIQGTGNGHISRGRMMAKHFAEKNIDVDYLFSGRQLDKYFDMEIFENFQLRRGMTFYSKSGRVSYPKTITSNNIFQFVREIYQLNVKPYDLIITDFEPVTAWAAKLRGIPTLGIGHQYAFRHNIPRAGENLIANLTIKNFAPAKESIGLHWSSFGKDILPPIIDNSICRWRDQSTSKKKIIVYLPFENQDFVQSLLQGIEGYCFYIYSPDLMDSDKGLIQLRKASHEGFKRDLTSAHGVICNAGFELISECLHLGLQIFTKPQAAQMEQQSNAAALEQLGYAHTTNVLTKAIIRRWLGALNMQDPIHYPDVADTLTDWIISNRSTAVSELAHELWQQVDGSSAKA
jgi:uncharacterized protein (TIGR00661 family)